MKRMALLLSFLIMPLAPALAGWVLEYENGLTTTIEDDLIRTGINQVNTVMDLEEGMITAFNENRRIYFRGTAEEVGQDIRAFVEKIKAETGVDPYQGMDPSAEMPPVRVEHLGEGDNIAGYDTEHFAVYVGDRKVEELWVAPALRFYTDRMANRVRELSRASKGPQMAGFDYTTSDAYIDLVTSQGYPLKRTHFMGGGNQTMQVRSVEERNIPASEFRVPEGYEQAGYVEVMGAGMNP